MSDNSSNNSSEASNSSIDILPDMPNITKFKFAYTEFEESMDQLTDDDLIQIIECTGYGNLSDLLADYFHGSYHLYDRMLPLHDKWEEKEFAKYKEELVRTENKL